MKACHPASCAMFVGLLFAVSAAVEDAIKAIEEAKDQPRLRSIAPSLQPRE